MQLLSQDALRGYLRHDWVAAELVAQAKPQDREFTSHRWLLESEAKRLVFDAVYGDLFRSGTARAVLDVGGGFCSLSRSLIRGHQYDLLEINAHDSAERLRAEEAQLGRRFWVGEDWFAFEPKPVYDLVIANDLFPNVDQRLALFLEKYLPRARRVRLSLTYYNSPRFYKTRRVDAGEEFLFVLAWDGEQTRRVLQKYEQRIVDPRLTLLLADEQSLFENKRQVCLVELAGDRQ